MVGIWPLYIDYDLNFSDISTLENNVNQIYIILPNGTINQKGSSPSPDLTQNTSIIFNYTENLQKGDLINNQKTISINFQFYPMLIPLLSHKYDPYYLYYLGDRCHRWRGISHSLRNLLF